jgi:hypothetical protein
MEEIKKRRPGRPSKKPADPDAPIRGRPKLGDRALTAKQIKARYTLRLKEKGGKSVTCVIPNGELVKILRTFALSSKKDFRSETAAASYILEQALTNLGRRMKHAQEKKTQG